MNELDRLSQKLDSEIAGLKRARVMTIVIPLVVVLAMVGYFSWISAKVRDLAEPKSVAEMASQYMVDAIPKFRPEIERAAREEAPAAVDEMVNKFVEEGIPAGRELVEKAAIDHGHKVFAEIEREALAMLDRALAEHGDELRAVVKDLATPEGTKAFEDELYKLIRDTLWETNAQAELKNYAIALSDIDGMLAHLINTPEAELTEHEKALHDLIAILREMGSRDRSMKTGS